MKGIDELRVALVLIGAGLVLISRRDAGMALLTLGCIVFVRSLLASDGPGGGGGGWWWGPAGGPKVP
ncbi:MAG: hypothetical protein M3O70_09180, partial [Actinomycetota bacterium]|nr:hypothetical protein [Actinomycetota bacterium]